MGQESRSGRKRHVMEGFHRWWARVSNSAAWKNQYDAATAAWRAAAQYERRKAKSK